MKSKSIFRVLAVLTAFVIPLAAFAHTCVKTSFPPPFHGWRRLAPSQ